LSDSGSTSSRTSGARAAGSADDEKATRAIAEALGDISQRAQLLVREEIELAKAEMRTKAARLARGAVLGALAAVFGLLSLLFLLHGVAWLLGDLVSQVQNVYWGYFILGGILLLLAALFGLLALRAIRKATPPAPQMAIEEAKLIRETVQESRPVERVPGGTSRSPDLPATPAGAGATGARAADRT
jgi:uncharacterized membrane protein YqjE